MCTTCSASFSSADSRVRAGLSLSQSCFSLRKGSQVGLNWGLTGTQEIQSANTVIPHWAKTQNSEKQNHLSLLYLVLVYQMKTATGNSVTKQARVLPTLPWQAWNTPQMVSECSETSTKLNEAISHLPHRKENHNHRRKYTYNELCTRVNFLPKGFI